MQLEELLEIKPQIESTRRGKYDISNKEFVWFYEKGKPLNRIRESKCPESEKNKIVLYNGPKKSNAIADIHNHPNGNLLPSFFDISSMLINITEYPKMRYSIIASTEEGEVGGFCVLKYSGKRNLSNELREYIEKRMTSICKAKCREDNLKWHSEIDHNELFSDEYIEKNSLSFMDFCNISWRTIAMHGYKIDDFSVYKK